MLLRKVFAHNAQISKHSLNHEALKAVANIMLSNEVFHIKLDAKFVRHRNERLQKPFNASNKIGANLLGLGGKLSKAYELLSSMREAREEELFQSAKSREGHEGS